ncbi:hypothetical protein K523DRAFT_357604 [Schizophyllum commune Tattone D]|nr:hypothetical protein K523DRAFT_357604 [Schizophyllum commune Tattone D]
MEHSPSSQQTSGLPPPPPPTTTTTTTMPWTQPSPWSWPPDPAAMAGPPMSGPPPTWPPPIQASTTTTQPPPQAPQPLPSSTTATPPMAPYIPPRPTQPVESAPDTARTPTETARPLQPPPAAAPPPLAPPPAPASLPPRPAPASAATHSLGTGGAGKKRKRRNKPKEERLNRKNWADGVRAEFMKPYVPRYVDAVAKGGWAAGQEVIRQLCAEYHAKIPWTLPYTKEPKLPLPVYDPNNPPVLEPLSDEEEAKRSAVLTELNGMIHRWVHWRAKKVPGYRQQYRANRNNPFDRLVLELCGMSPKGAKKALQPVQQYAHEHPEVRDEASRAFEDEKASKGFVKNGKNIIFKQTVNWTMGYVKKHYFDKLPTEEKAEYGARARETARREKEAWENALKEPPKQDAESIQMAWRCLDAFIAPLLRGLVTRMDANVALFIGARLPEAGGRPNSRHFVMGKNREGLPFSLWNESHFQKDVLGSFLDYIETIWSPEECAAVDLNNIKNTTQGTGSLGRTQFTAHEMEDEDEDDGDDEVEDDDDDDDEIEIPLASIVGGAAASGGARKRQKKSGAASSTTTATTTSFERTPTPATPSLGRTPTPATPSLEQTPTPATPSSEQAPAPPSSEQAPAPASAQSGSVSRHPEELDRQLIGRLDPQLIEQLDPEPVQAEEPAQPLRRSGRPSVLQRQRETLRSSSSATPSVQASTQRTRATAAVNGSASDDTPGPLVTPSMANTSSSSHTNAQPSPPTPYAPSPTTSSTTDPATARKPLQLPATAESNAAAAWFRDAWKYVAHDFGQDWAALVRIYGSWEEAHAYTSAKGATKALPTLNTRPKEIGIWISHARWTRGVSGEPNPKDFAFAQSLLRRWWEWYRRLSPGWRRTRADGTLEACTVLDNDMGKLECSGVNGVLNLIVVLKWVKEGLSNSDESVDDAKLAMLQGQWTAAVRDLQIMVHAMVEKKRKVTT